MNSNVEGFKPRTGLIEGKRLKPFLRKHGQSLVLATSLLLFTGSAASFVVTRNNLIQQTERVEELQRQMRGNEEIIDGFRRAVGKFIGINPEDCKPAIRGRSAGFLCRESTGNDTILPPLTPMPLSVQ